MSENASTQSVVPITVAIPTYHRNEVLIDSIRELLQLENQAAELLVIDQSETHTKAVQLQLNDWESQGRIRWVRTSPPSITKAMNLALREATHALVLFLDDDIRPRCEVFRVHADSHKNDPRLWATVGQVIQPWQEAVDEKPPRVLSGLRLDEDFPFHSVRDAVVYNVMAGNLCVNRQRALSIGGFDENFQGSAYRFETDFARRVGKAGGVIRFLGNAGIDHLRVSTGGTRSAGSHLTSSSPKHGVGDHYYAMRHAESPIEAKLYSARRILREVRTRFHLTHPWWIPVKLIGELRAYRAAQKLVNR